MTKSNIAIIFGGQSSEYDISCISAKTIIDNINREKYNITLIGITKEGRWLLFDGDSSLLENDKWVDSSTPAIISPDETEKAVMVFKDDKVDKIKIDVVFPVLHGLFGEDGTIQGLLELAKIPYVGCGVLASSVSMDKLFTKIVVDTLNIRQAKYFPVRKEDLDKIEMIIGDIEKQIEYPMFIKPSNAGSSVGITKAHNKDELKKGLKVASQHDSKILVEETIIGREVETAVLGGKEVRASGVGEILAAAEFYDYEAKYINAESKTIINADLDKDVIEKIRKSAVEIFKAVDGFGLSRVDFFVEKDTNEVVFNEINTLPGFTSISMYPMLWKEKGISVSELIDKLIQLAYKRR